MPYIVTTTNRDLEAAFEQAGGRGVELAEALDAARSRRAVATLDEAREAAQDVAENVQNGKPWREWRDQAMSLPEQGGTVGPLPDGTVIEVKRVDRRYLATELIDHEAVPWTFRYGSAPTQKLIAAYNAAQD